MFLNSNKEGYINLKSCITSVHFQPLMKQSLFFFTFEFQDFLNYKIIPAVINFNIYLYKA
jgi:hypothetical protein